MKFPENCSEFQSHTERKRIDWWHSESNWNDLAWRKSKTITVVFRIYWLKWKENICPLTWCVCVVYLHTPPFTINRFVQSNMILFDPTLWQEIFQHKQNHASNRRRETASFMRFLWGQFGLRSPYLHTMNDPFSSIQSNPIQYQIESNSSNCCAVFGRYILL